MMSIKWSRGMYKINRWSTETTCWIAGAYAVRAAYRDDKSKVVVATAYHNGDAIGEFKTTKEAKEHVAKIAAK